MKIKYQSQSLFKLIFLLVILGFKIHSLGAQARFFQQLNAHKWDVQPHDYTTKASNVFHYQNFHLGLFCNKDFIYKLYCSDSQTKTWKYIARPHEEKKAITDFIETDSNIFFFAWDNSFIYLYTIDKFTEIKVRIVDSFRVKNGNFTTFWTFSDPKSSFFVVSVSLTSIDSNYFYAANKYRMNIIRKYDGAYSGFVNRDAAALVDNRFILWDGTNYEIYDNSSLLNRVGCKNSSCNIDYISAVKYNDTIIIGSVSFASESLVEKLYLSKKDAKLISNCNIINSTRVSTYSGLKSTDSCIYYCPDILNKIILNKLGFDGKQQSIYELNLIGKTLKIAFLQKNFFIVQYSINNINYFDLLDLHLNQTFKQIRISTSKQIVNVEFSTCHGYFIFTQAQGGGRIGGFFNFNYDADSAVLIEELENPAYTHPLGDMPEIYEEHNRLYFYRENYTEWFTLAYYDLTDLCKKVNTRDELIVYPNPAHDFLYLTTDKKNVSIYNVIGQLWKRDVSTKWNSEQFIDISDLADGIYFLMINNKVLRFIKY